MLEIDPATRGRLRLLYPDIAVRARRLYHDFYNLHRLPLRCSETLRTLEWQEKLYAQGRSTPGRIVTYSKPGFSFHHYGCALDSCFVGPDPYLEKVKNGVFYWQEFGRLAKAHGFQWGGDWSKFVDRPHIQLSYGLSLDQLRGFYGRGGMGAVWRAFDKVRGVPEGQDWTGLLPRAKLLETGVQVP